MATEQATVRRGKGAPRHPETRQAHNIHVRLTPTEYDSIKELWGKRKPAEWAREMLLELAGTERCWACGEEWVAFSIGASSHCPTCGKNPMAI